MTAIEGLRARAPRFNKFVSVDRTEVVVSTAAGLGELDWRRTRRVWWAPVEGGTVRLDEPAAVADLPGVIAVTDYGRARPMVIRVSVSHFGSLVLATLAGRDPRTNEWYGSYRGRAVQVVCP